jgi:hypothetical protein
VKESWWCVAGVVVVSVVLSSLVFWLGDETTEQSSPVLCSQVQPDGMEWNGMEWNGMEWINWQYQRERGNNVLSTALQKLVVYSSKGGGLMSYCTVVERRVPLVVIVVLLLVVVVVVVVVMLVVVLVVVVVFDGIPTYCSTVLVVLK